MASSSPSLSSPTWLMVTTVSPLLSTMLVCLACTSKATSTKAVYTSPELSLVSPRCTRKTAIQLRKRPQMTLDSKTVQVKLVTMPATDKPAAGTKVIRKVVAATPAVDPTLRWPKRKLKLLFWSIWGSYWASIFYLLSNGHMDYPIPSHLCYDYSHLSCRWHQSTTALTREACDFCD